MTPQAPPRLLLVSSTGGHLTQLLALQDWWQEHERTWVSFDHPHARAALAEEDVRWAFWPTTRNLPNALRNARLARRVLADVRPQVVVSTGAGVAVPFLAMAHATGIRTMFLEVIDRVTTRTLTGRLVYPFVDTFAVQWPEQQRLYPGATVIGATL